jgi:hypothetical protein
MEDVPSRVNSSTSGVGSAVSGSALADSDTRELLRRELNI